MEIYKAGYQLKDERLRAGDLFRILEEVSTVHCNSLGLGADVIVPKGLIWVVARQRIDIERCPLPGEAVEVLTWPGINRHVLFPRFYQIKDLAGEKIASGCAVWTMVDVNTRKMISPAAYGLRAEGLVTGEESRLPTAPEKLPTDRSVAFTVPEEYLDVNGHMNNTRYYDLAESCIPAGAEGLSLAGAVTEYVSEALAGDKMTVSWGRDGDRFYVCGDSAGPVFKMSLHYKK